MLWLVLAGFAGGFLAGLLGIGGGIIYVVILPYALRDAGVTTEYLTPLTIANSIFGVLFASFATNYLNIRNKDFYLRESLWVGIPGAAFSVLILKTIVLQSWYSITYFYGILVLFLLYMLISLFYKRNLEEKPYTYSYKKTTLSFAGIIGGSLASATGLGGGGCCCPNTYHQPSYEHKKGKIHLPGYDRHDRSLPYLF